MAGAKWKHPWTAHASTMKGATKSRFQESLIPILILPVCPLESRVLAIGSATSLLLASLCFHAGPVNHPFVCR
ncbi:hypothetical protein BDV10DRAFT_176506, partial [Aspergillus recurvatus]